MQATASALEDKEGVPRNSIDREYLRGCAEAVAANATGGKGSL
jgi:hypothetical protein